MNNLTIKLLLFFFFCTIIPLRATEGQNKSIDSYLKSIRNLIEVKDRYKEEFLDIEYLLAKKEQAEGNEKILVLLKLFTAYIYKSDDAANTYNEQALELSEKIGFTQGILSAKYNKAYHLFVKGHFDASMKMVQEIENLIVAGSFQNVYGDIATLKSDIYTERGEYDKALEVGLQLLDHAEKTKSDYLLMKANAALSHYYLRIEQFSKSLHYCLQGLHYILKLKKTEYIYPKIDEIAKMTAQLNDPQGALEVYSFFLDIEKKLPPAGSYILASVHSNIANIYMSIGENKKALNHISTALEINYKNNYRFRIPRALTIKAKLYLQQHDTTQAILTYEKSIEAAEDINAFDVVKRNSYILGQLYQQTNEPLKSNDYKNLYKTISDSLFTNEQEQKILILETKRKVKEVLQKKKILELENKAQRAQFRGFIIALLFLMAISCIAVFSYLKVRKKNRLLLCRTIDLAEIQLRLSEKLNGYEQDSSNWSVERKKRDAPKAQPRLDEEIKNIILTKLEKLEKKSFFLDPNCNLHLLAEQLKTNPKYLSQVINQEKKSNFNNYINELRINYLLPKLLKDIDYRNNKLSYIAVSLGFNNLNTFNAAFKKRLGILPSNFINELNNNIEVKSKAIERVNQLKKIV
ncbi:helix-turn-helix domain-containing protein [Arenibacter aquaticus]|uniref:Helix-turn-helix domain-containing protein n=1 Tax=Arenibacter aquaticus TaxID=2489054 RepID=A0A3S0AGG0_9FLAO|nr:AraC family transcriptional regulator [Arenibacter aquaticus]RTE55179.1 helix-turn-helix domain-containing protein [Arenibacter aquaticus]